MISKRWLRVDVISETGWFDDARFKQNMADYGGSEQTQCRIPWDHENAGGYSALLKAIWASLPAALQPSGDALRIPNCALIALNSRVAAAGESRAGGYPAKRHRSAE